MCYLSYTPIDCLITAVIFLTMFGMGTGMSPADYKTVFKFPKSLIIGLIGQMIVLPLLVFFLIAFTPLRPATKVGFIILAACPGGATSGLISYLFRGNMALSVSLTSINSLLTVITIPILTQLGLYVFMSSEGLIVPAMPIFPTVVRIFSVTLVPVILGMLFSHFFEKLSYKLEKPIKWVVSLLFATVFAIKFLAKEDNGGSGMTFQELLTLTPFVFIITVVTYFAGYFVAKKLGFNMKTSFTLGIEMTMQNTALAILIAGTLLGSQQMLFPALVYGLYSFWIALLFTWLTKRKIGIGIFDPFPLKEAKKE